MAIRTSSGSGRTEPRVHATWVRARTHAALDVARRNNSPVDYYRPADDTAAGPHALLLAAELDDALRTGQLVLRYQPFIELTTGRPIGVEAIVSWLHPTRGLRPAQDFETMLPTRLLASYLDWLLHQALTDRASWHDIDTGLLVAVNLPPLTLLDRALPARIATALQAAGLRPHQLVLEFTACSTLNGIPTVHTALEALHALGLRIAVDDFGYSRSSFSDLLRAPITDIKIASDVIDALPTSTQARAIVRATREIADSADLRAIATGADTPRHVQAAYNAGIQIAQGNAICPPLLPSRVHTELLERTTNAAPNPLAQVIRLKPDSRPNDPG